MKPRTLSSFFEEEYFPSKLLARSPKTAIQYRNTIKMFSTYLKREATFADVSKLTVSAWFGSLLEKQQSVETLKKHRRQLIAIVNYAYEESLIPEKPRLASLPSFFSIPVSWTTAEIGLILQACSDTPGDLGKHKASDVWLAIIETIISTGARVGVVMSMPPSSFSPANRGLLLPMKFQKQHKDQWLSLTESAVLALQKVYDPSSKYLIPWPFDNSRKDLTTLHAHFRMIVARAGLNNEHGTFHRLRRWVATEMYKIAPESVQQQLGHSSPRVTDRYIDRRMISPVRTVDQIPRPTFNPQPPV